MKKFFIISIILFFTIITNKNTAKAEIIKGDKPLGGFSYSLNLYYNKSIKIDTFIQTLAWLNQSSYIYNVDKSQLEILQRITEAEATGGSIEQKENVASCVINRMLSSGFPNSVEKVVFQKRQFSPIDDGRYFTVSISEDTIVAVDNILKYGVTHTGLYFHAHNSKSKWFKNNLNFLFDDGIHLYYK